MEGTIGEIRMFGGNFAPRAWALCEGQLLDIASHSALFSILGTTYGGDGRSTFALPDLRGRVPVQPGRGPGLSAYKLGQKFGSETNTITVNQMPSHNHGATGSVKPSVNDEEPNSDDPAGNFMATGSRVYNSAANAQGGESPVSVTVENTGGGQPVNNLQPALCVNFIICLQGIYPSRN